MEGTRTQAPEPLTNPLSSCRGSSDDGTPLGLSDCWNFHRGSRCPPCHCPQSPPSDPGRAAPVWLRTSIAPVGPVPRHHPSRWLSGLDWVFFVTEKHDLPPFTHQAPSCPERRRLMRQGLLTAHQPPNPETLCLTCVQTIASDFPGHSQIVQMLIPQCQGSPIIPSNGSLHLSPL